MTQFERVNHPALTVIGPEYQRLSDLELWLTHLPPRFILITNPSILWLMEGVGEKVTENTHSDPPGSKSMSPSHCVEVVYAFFRSYTWPEAMAGQLDLDSLPFVPPGLWDQFQYPPPHICGEREYHAQARLNPDNPFTDLHTMFGELLELIFDLLGVLCLQHEVVKDDRSWSVAGSATPWERTTDQRMGLWRRLSELRHTMLGPPVLKKKIHSYIQREIVIAQKVFTRWRIIHAAWIQPHASSLLLARLWYLPWSVCLFFDIQPNATTFRQMIKSIMVDMSTANDQHVDIDMSMLVLMMNSVQECDRQLTLVTKESDENPEPVPDPDRWTRWEATNELLGHGTSVSE